MCKGKVNSFEEPGWYIFTARTRYIFKCPMTP